MEGSLIRAPNLVSGLLEANNEGIFQKSLTHMKCKGRTVNAIKTLHSFWLTGRKYRLEVPRGWLSIHLRCPLRLCDRAISI